MTNGKTPLTVTRAPLLLLFVLTLAACVAPQTASERLTELPGWYFDREAAYPAALYVTGTGRGLTRKEATAQAVSSLALFFETRIAFEGEILSTAQERILNGQASVAKESRIQDKINLKAQEELFGVQLEAVYHTQERQWTALAYMNRQEAAAIYTAQLAENMQEIENALAQAGQEEDPWRAFALLQKAEPARQAAEKYLKMLRLLTP